MVRIYVSMTYSTHLLVSNSEDGYLLSCHVDIGKGVVQEVIPSSSRALLISISVPSGSSNNEAVVSLDLVLTGISDILHVASYYVLDVCSNGLSISGGSRVVNNGSSVEGG